MLIEVYVVRWFSRSFTRPRHREGEKRTSLSSKAETTRMLTLLDCARDHLWVSQSQVASRFPRTPTWQMLRLGIPCTALLSTNGAWPIHKMRLVRIKTGPVRLDQKRIASEPPKKSLACLSRANPGQFLLGAHRD